MRYPENLTALVAAVRTRGVYSLPAGAIRSALGYGRLGCNVVNTISAALSEQNIAHDPDPFPYRQGTWVRLIDAESDYNEIAQAFADPSPENDVLIRRYVTAQTLVKKVQELAPAAGEVSCVGDIR